MRLRWSVAALADLNRFAMFLQDRYPSLSKRIGREIMERAEIVADYPDIGHAVGTGDYREAAFSVSNAIYIFRYRSDEQGPVILRVFHGREHRDL